MISLCLNKVIEFILKSVYKNIITKISNYRDIFFVF